MIHTIQQLTLFKTSIRFHSILLICTSLVLRARDMVCVLYLLYRLSSYIERGAGHSPTREYFPDNFHARWKMQFNFDRAAKRFLKLLVSLVRVFSLCPRSMKSCINLVMHVLGYFDPSIAFLTFIRPVRSICSKHKQKHNNHRSFWFVVEENTGKEITILSWCHHRQKVPF